MLLCDVINSSWRLGGDCSLVWIDATAQMRTPGWVFSHRSLGRAGILLFLHGCCLSPSLPTRAYPLFHGFSSTSRTFYDLSTVSVLDRVGGDNDHHFSQWKTEVPSKRMAHCLHSTMFPWIPIHQHPEAHLLIRNIWPVLEFLCTVVVPGGCEAETIMKGIWFLLSVLCLRPFLLGEGNCSDLSLCLVLQ